MQRPQMDAVRKRGSIPMIDWASWDAYVWPQYDQPDFSLRAIVDGKHDKYIRRWAKEARRWGHPFFVRFNWEMNGNWFPWSERRNGNDSGDFVAAWRHVHELFGQEDVDNVTWVWCPNVIDGTGDAQLEHYYPGKDYVDWLCMDGYNWGTNSAKPDRWKSFSAVFGETYAKLRKIAPDKPIMIGEVSATEIGGSKADWISKMLEEELPNDFPEVKALVWFNWNTDGMDWAIESSQRKKRLRGIAAPYYSGAELATSTLRRSAAGTLVGCQASLYSSTWASPESHVGRTKARLRGARRANEQRTQAGCQEATSVSGNFQPLSIIYIP